MGARLSAGYALVRSVYSYEESVGNELSLEDYPNTYGLSTIFQISKLFSLLRSHQPLTRSQQHFQ